ncbi:translesion error-prone DNA polymerase V autoproteolytic subunit [Laribacter hongkongensis]|uniref:translesion error-prone DNA polymerase V autoproteolytic subunit n=1 Tax=Laribacter hongkongensis TaxID=168471 RepID=UPI001EFD62B5|nr:translesion error-prone DNA polymerase V autoproteolytic subunit [Laribacter hongkongensis]MCG9042132.1 translesion error-prone DNA polymerase V autoproteolytic subunit [Laribacter hongkongensis]MCG9066937.1 translesion error-prone DNA polymerase V autoproteolytic subunit [Laribacter hongkongensis]
MPTLLALAHSPAPSFTPLMLEPVRAGFPSPAAAYTAGALDFNQYLVSNAAATFALYAAGDSMIDAGIGDGDLLVVDRAREALNGDIVVAQVGIEFTVKRLRKTADGVELHPENALQAYPVLRPSEADEWKLIGVVTFIVKKACPRSR